MTELEKKVYEMYKNIDWDGAKAGLSDDYKTYKSYNTGLWIAGEDYKNQSNKIMFIGKVARGDGGGEPLSDCGVLDVTKSARNLWNTKSWAYWSYTKGICRNIYKDESPEHIAFSNLIKINYGDTQDATTDEIKEKYIGELKVARREIEILMPDIVIFYTGRDYDKYIFNENESILDCVSWVKGLDDKKRISDHQVMRWYEGTGEINGKRVVFLRTGHPERKKRDGYISAVTDWIKSKM